MIVDAHQHFWRLEEPGRDWPTPSLAPLWRDFGPQDLAPLLREHGVAATVLVQSLPCERETARMLALAADTPWIAAVVGWTDLKGPDAAARIGQLAQAHKLRGLRPMLQNLADPDWIADQALAAAAEAMSAAGLAFDALVTPRHLGALYAFASRHPALPVVIDHAAKPPLAHAFGKGQWQEDMARLATLPNVVCKLSGLVTEALPDWQPRELQPWVAHVLSCFGPQRLLWGSDWPVVNLACDYARWLAASRALLAHLHDADRADIFGGNACRIYRIFDEPMIGKL